MEKQEQLAPAIPATIQIFRDLERYQHEDPITIAIGQQE